MIARVQRPTPQTRADTREAVALREVAEAQPELAGAVALELDLLEHERRLRQRLTTPWIAVSESDLSARLAAGHRLVELDDLPLDWPDLRLILRQVIDILHRHDIVDASQAGALHDEARGAALQPAVRRWFDEVPGAPRHTDAVDGTADPTLADVLGVALRPVLARMADVLRQRVAPLRWTRGCCPVCGAEPVFGVLPGTGERQLVCGRCQTQWPFDPLACPFCGTDDRRQLAAFAMPDSPYRLAACRACRRYVKTLDVRRANRPLLWPVDLVATLPLDAAAAQQGFTDR